MSRPPRWEPTDQRGWVIEGPAACRDSATRFDNLTEFGALIVSGSLIAARKILKPIDKVSLGEITSHRAVTTVNVDVASKMSSSEGRARNRRVKAAWGAEI
jgi:hypothetical protein